MLSIIILKLEVRIVVKFAAPRNWVSELSNFVWLKLPKAEYARLYGTHLLLFWAGV